VDLTGAPPGWCAIDFVRDETSPLWVLVFVMDRLHVPPSWARAFDIAMLLFGLL
jgi:hypothetical protein